MLGCTCVCKVPSNICRVKEASVAKPTRISYLGFLVYTFVEWAFNVAITKRKR